MYLSFTIQKSISTMKTGLLLTYQLELTFRQIQKSIDDVDRLGVQRILLLLLVIRFLLEIDHDAPTELVTPVFHLVA